MRTHQSRSCPHNPRLVHPWWPGTPGPSPRPWVSAWRQFYFVSRSAAGLTACTRLSGVPVGCNRRVIGAARAVRRCPSRPRESVADGCLVCGRLTGTEGETGTILELRPCGFGGMISGGPSALQLQLWATTRVCDFCGDGTGHFRYECRVCGLALCWPHSRGHVAQCEAVVEACTDNAPWIYAPPGNSCLHCGFAPPNQGRTCPLGQCLTCGACVCAGHRRKHDKMCSPEIVLKPMQVDWHARARS